MLKGLWKTDRLPKSFHSHYLVSATALSDQKQHHTRWWFFVAFFFSVFFFNTRLAEGQSETGTSLSAKNREETSAKPTAAITQLLCWKLQSSEKAGYELPRHTVLWYTASAEEVKHIFCFEDFYIRGGSWTESLRSSHTSLAYAGHELPPGQTFFPLSPPHPVNLGMGRQHCPGKEMWILPFLTQS